MSKTPSIQIDSNPLWKKILPHAVAVVIFMLITVIYFFPIYENKTLPGHDITQFQGGFQELQEYYEKEGQSSEWTGSMFSGMPAYQIGIAGGNPNFLDYLEKPLTLLGGNSLATPFFISLLMTYIMFCIMGVGPFMAIFGAIAYSFSSYNIIIIEAGHATKVWCLAYMPLLIGGMIGLFKKRLVIGGICLMLGLAYMIRHNHLQIVYYVGLFCIIMYLWFVVKELLAKKFTDLFKVLGISLIAVLLAVCCNLGSFYGNYEMSKESIRGQTELSAPTEIGKQSSGLDKEYAFRWSYGKSETLTLLIPDAHGGVSKPFDNTSDVYKLMMSEFRSNPNMNEQDAQKVYSESLQYWGTQPFTSGPVYFGAIICALFILGMVVIKNPVKWVLLGATLFFVLLSWGRHFEPFNDWMFHYLPFYNKFRTVSMALVIPSITLPIIAIWGLKEFFELDDDKKQNKVLYWSFGVPAAICALFWILPTMFFNFTSEKSETILNLMSQSYFTALINSRKELLSADALRSLIFVVLGGVALWTSVRMKKTSNITTYTTIVLAVLVLVDLWGIDRRYLNETHFVPKSTQTAKTFKKSVATQIILQDTNPSYRVLTLGDPFNEAITSYYHQSIGGYHAAKLRRYQEMVDARLGGEVAAVTANTNAIFQAGAQYMQSAQQQGISFTEQDLVKLVQDSVSPLLGQTTVLNMLNAKYLIYHPSLSPIVNHNAYGNAWFVNEYTFVDNADAELAAINTINPLKTAVIDKRYAEELTGLNIVPDSAATIELTVYKPNRLVYKTKSNSEQLAIFSEIYYPHGWDAYIDGKLQSHFCADWMLRAMRVPAGEHEIEFKFEPKEYHLFQNISTAASVIVVLIVLAALFLGIFRTVRKPTE